MNKIAFPSKKTKIVCTIGPASQSRETLEAMIANGMNVARLNFAHGDFESHGRIIQNIRAAAAAVGQRVAIMGDLPGPKMRIGRLVEEPLELERGQSFILQVEEIVGDAQRVSMSFAGLPKAVRPGDRIFVNDGYIQLRVEEVVDQEVRCQVMVGGELRSFKGVNLPGIGLGISAFTERDRELLHFAAEQRLDAVSQSFVQGPGDITVVRETAAALDYHPFIIAKIERALAVDNIEEILESADGIMVARGDLGVEIPIEEIAITQKHLIDQANLAEKPAITATQMLASMVINPRPTRAEATDVANAILDGTDCVMLSEETATGVYPEEAVAVMARIARVTEPHMRAANVAAILKSSRAKGKISPENLVSLTVYQSVEVVEPVAVMTPTLSGNTSRLVGRFRLPMWIVAVSPNESTCQTLQFSYGVLPVHETVRPERWDVYARSWFRQAGITDGLAVLTRGRGSGQTGGTNQIEVIDLAGPLGDMAVW